MPEQVSLRLRCGLPLGDADFDGLYPEWVRDLSSIHWTPVAVARRAAELLVNRPGTRVLDVGAGVGKFCLVGALSTTGVFYGIEQRFHFVKLARETCERLGLRSARFLHGNLLDVEWYGFDAYYLYNPFAENLPGTAPLDDSVERGLDAFRGYVRAVRERLYRSRKGTRVVTYHGFGGDFPPGYRLEREEEAGSERLELWVKTS